MQTPKGKIVAIGGNVDKGSIPLPKAEHLRQGVRFFENGILKRIHDELFGPATRIEIITSASLIPEEMGQAYVNAFQLLNCDNVGVLHIQSREDAERPDTLDRLRKTYGVMFTGGNQNRIARIFYKTKALEILKRRYLEEEKFLISGTSAGAMALCKIMIKGSAGLRHILKGNVHLGKGIGLLKEIVIDTHFVDRRRFPRLIETIAADPKLIGVGLGEDTGILISGGEHIETIGSGLVVVMDGRNMLENNYRKLHNGEPICMENIIMHILPRGKAFLMNSGELI